MNDMVKFAGNLPVSTEDLEAGLRNVQSSIQGSQGGLPFLRLMRSGLFVYGAENVEVEEGSEWAINPYSMMHGFACWAPGELLDERMVPFTQPPPNKSELPDLGQRWDQQVAMQLQCVSGEDLGQAVLYKGTSTGLRNAAKELINALISQLQHDKVHIVPIVELESDSYRHKEYGQIFYPILSIKRWVDINDFEGDDAEPEDDAEDEPEVAEKAPARRGRAAKAAPAAAGDADSGVGNRRRRRRNG